ERFPLRGSRVDEYDQLAVALVDGARPLRRAGHLRAGQVDTIAVALEHLERDTAFAVAVRRETIHVARAPEGTVTRLVVLRTDLPRHRRPPYRSKSFRPTPVGRGTAMARTNQSGVLCAVIVGVVPVFRILGQHD